MSETINLTIDGKAVEAQKGQTILEAADAAGVYIPRLCFMKGLIPAGACRVCTVVVNGRPCSACTQPVTPGMVVQSETPEIQEWRKSTVEMLFVEGNHYCMFCEKSGNCELQATAYRMGIAAPRHTYQFPTKTVDATHADVMIDRNRCILCGRCARATRQLDHKAVFGGIGRGHHSEIGVNAEKLGETELKAADQAADACPVGAILRKRVGFKVPVGQRLYDSKPIGSDIEKT